MAWYASPVAKRCYSDAAAKWAGIKNLGYIGDVNHQGSYSGHNVGRWAEAHRYNYGVYDGSAVLAVDIGVPNSSVGYAIVNWLMGDNRVLYTIYRAQGRRPNWRGGASFSSSGHMTHVHVSFVARATHDTRPFFGAAGGGSVPAPSPIAPPLFVGLNIGGLKVADMTKEELGRWLREQRELHQEFWASRYWPSQKNRANENLRNFLEIQKIQASLAALGGEPAEVDLAAIQAAAKAGVEEGIASADLPDGASAEEVVDLIVERLGSS